MMRSITKCPMSNFFAIFPMDHPFAYRLLVSRTVSFAINPARSGKAHVAQFILAARRKMASDQIRQPQSLSLSVHLNDELSWRLGHGCVVGDHR